MTAVLDALAKLPRTRLGHTPTPLERMPNLSSEIGRADLWVKRDDCTGLAFGGNKVRQLEFYMGQARAEKADSVLITGAIQSNFVRSTAAAANQLGLACHVQLEERVPDVDAHYRQSGNVLIDQLLGATIYSYPAGEDESGADEQLQSLAAQLRSAGQSPYQIHLAPGHAPLGALGYICAADEILSQSTSVGIDFDEICVASGSGHTHAGLLFGLRCLGYTKRVTGICVRRDSAAQQARLRSRCVEIADLLGLRSPVGDEDIFLMDEFLPPGYGQLNDATLQAIKLAARTEALLLDPVYTGKAMAGFIARAKSAAANENLLFVHTGGTPAIFAYQPTLAAALSASA